jgi:hypothetical protein
MNARQQAASVRSVRDSLDRRAQALGHQMTWQAGRSGTATVEHGRCGHCGAEAVAGPTWSTCGGVRDARKVRCSGPGTAVLTDIESGRAKELAAGFVGRFVRSLL